jgi:UDP-N-acetylbacillosamine N-acetyltransferase
MNKNLLILGAGGHGKVVKETAMAMGCFESIDFLDDQSEVAIGKCKDYKQFAHHYAYAFIAIGTNVLRMNWAEELIEAGFQLPVLIHPTAYVSPSATVEAGSIVCAKAVVHTNAFIKRGCIISIGALVDHDSFIDEYTHIDTGAIVKAGSKVDHLKKVDTGMVYSNKKKLEDYSFEIGV